MRLRCRSSLELLCSLRAILALLALALSASGCCGCGDAIELIFLTPSGADTSSAGALPAPSSSLGAPSPLRPPSGRSSEGRGRGAFVPAALTAPPGVELTTEINHYDVEGQTADAVRRDIDARRPVGADGAHDARTDWYVTWTYQKVPSRGRCGLEDVNVKLSVRYQLPRWNARSGAPESLTDRWDRYLAALTGHERNHALHGISAAAEVRQMLEGSGSDTCGSAEADANRQAQAIVDKYHRKDASYDRATTHGKTEGAVFP